MFDCRGGEDRECVTVRWALPTEEVRANAEPRLAAPRANRQVSGDLARRLALRRGVPLGRPLEDG
ncbi:MAG TPA: hypothetical protein VH092_20185 [Urbifossiella sp.]|nr:hypothetical protein [Urbifossiella sp.]